MKQGGKGRMICADKMVFVMLLYALAHVNLILPVEELNLK